MKEQPKDKFLITVKKGHAVVKIYQVKNPETVNYCRSYIGPTGRQRRNFADLDVAKGQRRATPCIRRHGSVEADRT